MALSSRADTVAWWRFDEADPGDVATAGTIASGTSPEVYAEPYSMAGHAASSSGSYLPVHDNPASGMDVFDPVQGVALSNRSAMRFSTAAKDGTPAYYGGTLVARTGDGQYAACTSSFTVEAMVKTSGGSFSTFAPIVACMNDNEDTGTAYSWMNEIWAIYMKTDGSLAIRFYGGNLWHDGAYAGHRKINDGEWHHVAITYDGRYLKVFVDYEQDTFETSGTVRQFDRPVAGLPGGAITYRATCTTHIGGYMGDDADPNPEKRRFNGLIDEVRVSSTALSPEFFLRTLPVGDSTTVAWWHFDEASPGTVASSGTIAALTKPEAYAEPYSLEGTNFLSSGDYMPRYAEPRPGRSVCDPVSGVKYANAAAMKFETAANGDTPAYYGGTLVARTGSGQYASCTNSWTVEAYVCTTGGSFETYAPIVACMNPNYDVEGQDYNWQNEIWAIYMKEADGTLAIRFYGSLWGGYSGHAGTKTINDGEWHHVAVTWDGATVKVYVDHDQDVEAGGSPREMTLTLSPDQYGGRLYFGPQCTTHFGGYIGHQTTGTAPGRRRFNGLIDEVRVSNVALPPEKFLKMAAIDVAWIHFDEAAPGTTAAGAISGRIAANTTPAVNLRPYSYADNAGKQDSGAWLPVFAKPFQGLCVYDPVSGAKRTNRSAMKFATGSEGSQDTYYGGALYTEANGIFDNCTNAITIEAFVCTTGGVYNTFAPIVACMPWSNWAAEKWAIYEETDGTIALRFNGTAYYSGNSDQAGTAKINDGAWHHVAVTWDGATVRIFVDHVQDTFANGNPREFSNSGTISYKDGGGAYNCELRVGGYKGSESRDYASRRRFNGLVDEVRISNMALTPDQFLQMRPVDMDDDEIVRISFNMGEYGVLTANANLADALGPGAQTAYYKTVAGAGPSHYDTTVKAGPAVYAGAASRTGVEDASSYCQATNAAGKANYIAVLDVSGLVSGNDGASASYTIEMFYKTRGRMEGSESNRQFLFRFGSNPFAAVFLNNTGNNLLYVTKAVGDTTEGSRARKADDTSWHHVALVVDGGSSGKATWYYDYVPDKSYSGATVDVGTGSSLFFGADSDGSSRWFDGWLDDIRVTRRALSPDEFLTTHSVGAAGADASLLAMFENDYGFACLSDESLSLTGSGRARAGGSAPEFVGHSCGIMRLDGQNGVVMTNSAYSAYLDKSVVSFPESPLYAFESYTVEFWAKFKGLVDGSGAVAADSESLANAAPIIRLVPADKGVCADMDDYDWYLYRKNDAAGGIQIAVNGACGDTWDVSPSMPEAWTVPGGLVVDDKWHHWALEFAPNAADSGKTDITLFRDYASLGVRTVNKRLQRRVGGDELLIGEGTYDEPNIQSYFGALRFSAGVLDPSRFLGRIPACLFILYH